MSTPDPYERPAHEHRSDEPGPNEHRPHEHRDPFPGFPVDSDVTREADVPPPRIHTTALGAVAVGGALGAMARWGVAKALPHDSGQFPWSTLLTNVLGCFLIGVLMVLVVERWPAHPLVRPFFGTGILGGFTTFSTYTVDIRAMVAADRPASAAAYLVATLVVGLAAVVLGLRVTGRAITARGVAERVVR
jgi:fluoride exporter